MGEPLDDVHEQDCQPGEWRGKNLSQRLEEKSAGEREKAKRHDDTSKWYRSKIYKWTRQGDPVEIARHQWEHPHL
jgi:hypothetical protein